MQFVDQAERVGQPEWHLRNCLNNKVGNVRHRFDGPRRFQIGRAEPSWDNRFQPLRGGQRTQAKHGPAEGTSVNDSIDAVDAVALAIRGISKAIGELSY